MFSHVYTQIFPYFCGYPDKYNISIHAQPLDYHKIVKDMLAPLAKELGGVVAVDIGTQNDVRLAAAANLGFIGRNNLLITPKYGSYVFIGSILNNEVGIKVDKAVNNEEYASRCGNCDLCIKHCAGKAITENGFYAENCVSYITQKKGILSVGQEMILKKSGFAYGCDICQKVCPFNNNVMHTSVERFRENLIFELENDIINMSNKAILARYAGRAFTWRGASILRRNVKILNDCW